MVGFGKNNHLEANLLAQLSRKRNGKDTGKKAAPVKAYRAERLTDRLTPVCVALPTGYQNAFYQFESGSRNIVVI
jgi:hypothetical protein